MDWQYVADTLFGVVSFLLLLWFNSLSKDLKTLTEKVENVEKLVLGDYVKKDEFVRVSNQLLLKMDSIYEKLDKKADK